MDDFQDYKLKISTVYFVRHVNTVNCIVCLFRKICNHELKKPSEFVHIDLCGKMTHPSMEPIITLCSKMTVPLTERFILLNTRMTLSPSLLNIINLLKTGNKLKRVRSDKGTEFDNEQFKQYFREKGINHEYSAPYIAEQNGRIE